MASGGKRGASDRVLESRHVIGLFMLMLLFSGVFFTLGYVMGRNQLEGQVRAASDSRSGFDQVAPKPPAQSKHSLKSGEPSDPPTSRPTAEPPLTDSADPEWEFYDAGKSKPTEDHLKPAPAGKALQVAAKNNPAKTTLRSSGPTIPAGAYTLQVAALTRQADALDLAARLQKKRFPAFVVSPQSDRYFRVQVGPYADQRSAEQAKKGLEGAGFRAIVKH
jgi:cell division septation protein DedD